ncbi:LysM peptidoglycan-binding domain-containing protein [Candidatus Dojkabacteria bacterium]|uniref:LysM peptidoglycan-binding domain-containing protein n=1 Tax=Candidatus Dojkabacteria bacterium TaxID=2099670 RepID=A0A955L3S7_9BACT|nr:LysM peptidoglycan-binding domain-containing protein [Candidatus Dojkabacteria bacterium]
MAEKKESQDGFKLSKTKAVVIAILALVLLSSLSYGIYLRVNKDDSTDEKVITLDEGNNSSSENMDKAGSIDENAAEDSSVKIEDDKAVASERKGEVAGVQFDPSTWKATDYKEGEIKGDSYTVKLGDTLWEIAEARYGSGSQWKKILTANDIDYLPNGNPLIIPGQVLVLPT